MSADTPGEDGSFSSFLRTPSARRAEEKAQRRYADHGGGVHEIGSCLRRLMEKRIRPETIREQS